MKIAGANGAEHLTYCTNIHKGETWADTRAALARYVPAVKAHVAPAVPFGVGLRLSALASTQLAAPGELDAFRDFLRTHNLYVFTINGFPYGPFHGTRVKEDVYQPDWRTPERLAYSNRLADQLALLLPDDPGIEGSISTVPATFRPLGKQAGALAQITENLLQHVAHLVRLEARTGRRVTVALEPEPMCYLETSDEAIDFFQAHFLAASGVHRLAAMLGCTASAAEAAIRRHLGVCYDVCHAAVEFEDAEQGIGRLRAAGIGIFKLQISAALRVPAVDAQTKDELKAFDDGIYLHQVVERKADGTLVRYLDLADAFAGGAMGSEWRVHCHVPIFHAALPRMGTTQAFLREILAMHRKAPISRHLEVETYTFDVLPAQLRTNDAATAVARELTWVREQLGA